MQERKNSEGRVILFLAVVMLGGALFMLGKKWYEHSQKNDAGAAQEEGLTELRYLSPQNILDRISKNEELHFIDIRPRESFEQNHIIDSEWLGLPEIAYYNASASKLIIIVHGEENTNTQLREINTLYAKKNFPFVFLEGGIKNWVALGGAVISEGNPDSYIDRTKVIPIAPEKVTELRESLVRSIVVDVRNDIDFRAGHIPGAINLPFSRLEKDRSLIPSLGSLFVYGANEAESFQAGTKLFDMGYIGLRVISGGFMAWEEKRRNYRSKNSQN